MGLLVNILLELVFYSTIKKLLKSRGSPAEDALIVEGIPRLYLGDQLAIENLRLIRANDL